MKRFRLSARRLLSLGAAAVAGLAATLVIASPASAHDATVEGQATCDTATGSWVVTWTVTNDFNTVATLSDVVSDPDGSAITNNAITNGSTVPAGNGTLVGHQTFPANQHSASLSFIATWPDEFSRDKDRTIEWAGTCTQAYTVEQTCEGITFTFTAPQAAAAAVTTSYHLHPSTGSDVDVSIKTGDQAKTVNFPGSPGLTVEVSQGERAKQTYTWTHEPCPSPSPSLPTTGSHLTGTIGIGAGLVAGGVGLIALLFVLRRRRTAASS